MSAVVVGAFSAVGLPAAGAAPTTITESAVANWQLSGPILTNVGLQASEVSNPALSNLVFFVSQEFCDVAHNQTVTRVWTGQQPVTPAFFTVFRNLAGAVLAVPAVQVSGTEQRVHGCNSPSGTPKTIQLGTSTVSLFASWSATGPVFVRQPGETGRMASADGLELSRGRLNLGDLGASTSAEIDRTVS